MLCRQFTLFTHLTLYLFSSLWMQVCPVLNEVEVGLIFMVEVFHYLSIMLKNGWGTRTVKSNNSPPPQTQTHQETMEREKIYISQHWNAYKKRSTVLFCHCQTKTRGCLNIKFEPIVWSWDRSNFFCIQHINEGSQLNETHYVNIATITVSEFSLNTYSSLCWICKLYKG